MAISKEKKKGILDKVKKIFDEAKTVVFVNFHGLSVKNATDLRQSLRKAEIGYFVAKKTLIRKVLEDKNLLGNMPVLEGEIGIAWGAEETAPAREVFSFGKKMEQGLKLVGGFFGGKLIGQKEIESIAMIPSKEVLRAQFVNLINSPIQRFVISLGQIASKKN